MRYWKEGLISALLVILVLSLVPSVATDYYWNTDYGNWSTSGNWIPAGPPGSSDDAYVGAMHESSEAYLSSNASVGNLYVTNDHGGTNWVWTHGNRLLVYGTTDLTETAGGGSVTLYVASGAVGNDFDTNYLNINGGAELNMVGGLAQIDVQLDVDSSSYIVGYGTIEFNSNDTRALQLAGTLRTDHATESLTLRMTGSGKLDLDGSSGGDSVIDVTTGTSSLYIDGQLSDSFSGTMTIGEGNRIDFTQPWSTDAGVINFNAGSGMGTLSGATVTIANEVNVNSGTGLITADVVFNPFTAVSVASGAELRLDGGQTTYKGGSYTGAGTLLQDDVAVIAENTTINTSYYDWDGVWGTSQTTVNSDKTFTINSSIADVHNGTITVDGGKIVVNSPWVMAGTLNLTSNGNVLDGARMTLTSSGTMNCTNYPLIYAPVTIAGTVTVSPSVVFRGDTIFESTATVNLAAGEYINLYGTTTYRGGTFSSGGFIRQNGDATIEADTTIGVSTFDLDGVYENATVTINPDITFTLNVNDVEYTGGDGYDGTVNVNSGTLVVNTSSPWAMEGTMNLLNTGLCCPNIDGAEMIVRNSSAGEGINASGGTAWIHCPITFESTAKVNVAAGSSIVIYDDTTYKGGSFTGDGRIYQYGDMHVMSDTTIDIATFSWNAFVGSPMVTTVDPGATLTINSSLYGDEVRSNISINGGTIVVNTPNPWRLLGTMNLNYSSGWAYLQGTRMILDSTSTLNLNYGNVSAPITAEGTVNVSTYGYLTDPVFESTASVNVAAGGWLALTGAPTIYRGGSYTGDGTLHQNGLGATVEADTTIDIATYDWDGTGEWTPMTINPGVTFTINSTSIDSSGDGYDGTVTVQNGATLLVNTPGAWTLEGQMDLAGGKVTGSGFYNSGTINGYGLVEPNGLTNYNMMSFHGGTSKVYNSVYNEGDVVVSGCTTSFFGYVTNASAGTIKNTNGTIYFNSGFTNYGKYESDPGDNHFNNIYIESSGYLVGGAGDRFLVSENFVSHSTANTLWETSSAELIFPSGPVGPANAHEFYLTGADLGLNMAGFINNFAWGTLSLEYGQWVVLVDGNATAGGAVYVEELLLDAGTRIKLNGMNIYYLNGGGLKQYFCGDATLDGRVDDDDLNIILTDWGKTVPPANPRADLSGDFQVDDNDLNILLSDWGKGVPPAMGEPVPEPMTIVLLIVGSAGVIIRRKKQQ